MPPGANQLKSLGGRLLALRKARHIATDLMAERAGIPADMLVALEQGSEDVPMGAYTAVMMVLGVEGDLARVADVDPLVRQMQESRLEHKVRELWKRLKDGEGTAISAQTRSMVAFLAHAAELGHILNDDKRLDEEAFAPSEEKNPSLDPRRDGGWP